MKSELLNTQRDFTALTTCSEHIKRVDIDRQIAKLPCADDAAFDSQLWEQKPQCLPETRVQLRRQIEAWSERPHGPCVFWLKGMAGTGKSTIARTIANNLAKQKRLGASFFFSRGQGDLGYARKFFTTIAAQLAANTPLLREHISSAVAEKDAQVVRQGLAEQWKRLIYQPLSSLQSPGLTSLVYVVVIDALDECEGENDVRLILRLLAETKTLKAVQLRVFITSRPETPIRFGFRSMPEDVHQDVALHDIDEVITHHDIFLYISNEFEGIRKEHEINQGWPSKTSIELLAKDAKGLFIYAATASRFVRSSKVSSPEDCLSLILQGSTASKSPTGELDRIYTQVLAHSLMGDCDIQEKEELAEQFRQVVGAIIILFDALGAIPLAGLIDLPERRVISVLSNLHSLLDVSEIRPIRLLHPSLRDFLLDKSRCKTPEFYVHSERMHEVLYLKCIRLMGKHLTEDICNLHRPGALVTELENGDMEKHIPPHVQYACRYWVDHYTQSGKTLSDNDYTHSFLQEHFLHWLEVLSWIGRISDGVIMVRTLESMLIVSIHISSCFTHAKFTRPEITQIHGFSRSSMMPNALFSATA
jgi:hypothetical protein